MLQDSLERYVEQAMKPVLKQINELKAEVEELKKALRKTDVSGSALVEILKSDSVYRLLRYGVKSPSSSGMDDCEDDHYYTLYNLVTELRQHFR